MGEETNCDFDNLIGIFRFIIFNIFSIYDFLGVNINGCGIYIQIIDQKIRGINNGIF